MKQDDLDSEASKIVKALKSGDKPAFQLYLRPFWITKTIALPNPQHSRELLNPSRFSESEGRDFEQILTTAATLPTCPLIALGSPGETLGAGRVAVPDQIWADEFLILAQAAERIFVVPSVVSRWLQPLAIGQRVQLTATANRAISSDFCMVSCAVARGASAGASPSCARPPSLGERILSAARVAPRTH